MSVLIAVVILAWIAILLLGLAVGGLLAQVRKLEAGAARQGAPVTVVPRLMRGDSTISRSSAFAAVFVDSSCATCHLAVVELFAELDGGKLLIVTDELPAEWTPLPSGVEALVDAGAIKRSGVPAVPWFAAVDATGQTVESFALGNPRSISHAAEVTHELSMIAGHRPSENGEKEDLSWSNHSA